MKTIIFHPEAALELEEAAVFHEERRVGYGELFRAEVDAALKLIGAIPTVFTKYRGGPVRRCLLKRFPYGVYFLERDNAFYIAAIMDQRRRPNYWIDRLKDL